VGHGANDNRSVDWPGLLAEQARANSKLLLSLAIGVLKDRQAAEDACQKALLSAWIRRNDIVDASRLKGWLATAVINESLAVLRRKKVERRVLTLVAVGGAGGAATGVTNSSENGELRQATLLALADLSDDERAVVTLRVMQDLSGREVAVILGISDGQVSKLLHRGMEELRGTLAQWNNPNR
jgi:RNA polymerase sigma factor (sigma-70 family)